MDQSIIFLLIIFVIAILIMYNLNAVMVNEIKKMLSSHKSEVAALLGNIKRAELKANEDQIEKLNKMHRHHLTFAKELEELEAMAKNAEKKAEAIKRLEGLNDGLTKAEYENLLCYENKARTIRKEIKEKYDRGGF